MADDRRVLTLAQRCTQCGQLLWLVEKRAGEHNGTPIWLSERVICTNDCPSLTTPWAQRGT